MRVCNADCKGLLLEDVFYASYLGWCSLLLLCGMYVYTGLLVLASVLLVGVW